MTKNEFLNRLSEELSSLEQMERVRMVQYYREILEDRVEDGLTEEQAVAEMEPIEDIAARILEEMGPRRANQDQPEVQTVYVPQEKKRSGWNIALLVLGSPVWLPLLAAFGIVLLSIYIVAWALIISLYAVVISLLVAGIAGVVGLFWHLNAHFMSGIFLLGSGLFCAGLGLLLLFPMVAATKALARGSAQVCKSAWNAVIHRNRG